MSKLKRILAWKPNWRQRGGGGRWYKYVDGCIHYFGHAPSETDSRAYREAEQRYLDFMRQREARQSIEVPVRDLTVKDAAEKYLQGLEQRYQRAEISAGHFDRSRRALREFAAAVGPGKKLDCIGELGLEDYKNYALSRPVSEATGKQVSIETVKGDLTIVRSFFRWAWKTRLLDNLPRNLDDIIRSQQRGQPEVLTFAMDELKTFWDSSSSRLRCWMALALNAGLGQRDIGELKVSDVDWEKGYLERDRHKTKVRAKHKLWPLTLRLMKEQRNPAAGPDDLLFISEDGLPLVWAKIVDGRMVKSDSIKCLFWRLQQETGINGHRGFYALRKTGASLIERIDPLVTGMYLSHSEKAMKKHYAERDWDRLERAIGELGLQLKDALGDVNE